MNVAVYYRVSTKGQGEDDRLGLPSQRAGVERYCKRSGHTTVREYEDKGFSGATADRPGLARLLAEAAAGAFDALVVYKWDRIARDTTLDGYLRYRLRELGVKVLSATEENGVDPASNLTASILAAVAQFERSLIAQRLTAARRVKKERGGYAGGKPRYGMRAVGGNLEPNESELEVVRVIRELRRQRKSLRKIGAELDRRGIPSRQGKQWSAAAVNAILNRRASRKQPA